MYNVYVDTSVCLEVSISNVIPESLDICPQLHLKQISQSSGITLLIHTPPDTHTGIYMYMYMYTRDSQLSLGSYISEVRVLCVMELTGPKTDESVSCGSSYRTS